MTTIPAGYRASQGPTPERREQFLAKRVADLDTRSVRHQGPSFKTLADPRW